MHLSGGECHDAPEGRKSIEAVGKSYEGVPLLMDKAYEGDETRSLARANGHEPIVPPKSNRADPWEYDKETLASHRKITDGTTKPCPLEIAGDFESVKDGFGRGCAGI